MRSASVLLGLAALFLAGLACEELPRGPMSFNGIPGQEGSLPSGQGVGEDCSSDPCRPGLDCVGGVCEPGMSLAAGDACVIGPECQTGLQCLPVGPCPDGQLGCPVCTPSGSGQAGDACRTDVDCSSGLRCGLRGFSAECVPAGEGDFGASCTEQTDCYQGLFCVEGQCSLDDPRWQGVSCPESGSGAAASLFQVPGAAQTPDDADFFSLPFPNDIRTDAQGRPDLDGFPTPGSALLGQDVVARYVEAVEENTNGFSTNPTIVFRFSAPVELDSFQERVNLVDLSSPPGTRLGAAWATGGRTNYVCDNWVSFTPPLGVPLAPSQTHALWIEIGATDQDGNPMERSPEFAALLGDSPPQDSALAAAYDKYAPLRDYFENADIDPDTILVAAVFTTDDPVEPMRALAQLVAQQPVPEAKSWVRCAEGAESPCAQADGGRACGSGSDDFDEFQALIELPIFQQGAAPYLAEGGAMASSVQRSEDVCMSLSVPKGAAPAEGWPVVVYGHGTGGSYRGGLRDEVAGQLARATPAMAVLTIDQVQHGPRRGDSQEQPDVLFFNFLNPDAARGNPLQGAVDQLSVLRFVETLDVTVDGQPIKADPARVLLFGHSQGATHASLALPFSRFPGAVLSGNGASLKHALLDKTNPVNIAGALPIILQDADAQGNLRMGDKHPVLGLLQHYIDVADPLNFAPLPLARPEAGQSVKHVLQTFGLDDTYSPPRTMAAYTYASEDMSIAPAPGGLSPSGDNELRIAARASAVSGNVTVDDITVTAAARQYDGGDRDGHFVAFDNEAANADVVGFLRSLAQSEVPTVPVE